MAVTNQRVSKRRSAAEATDFSASDGIMLKRSDDSDMSNEFGSPSKHPKGRVQSSRLQSFSRRISFASEDVDSSKRQDTFNTEEFSDKRAMTPTQERFNAITMIPIMIYPIYFILSGSWMNGDNQHGSLQLEQQNGWADIAREAFGNEHAWIGNFGCISIPTFPSLTALPPMPVVAAAVGILMHSPFSMLYHWKYATIIEPSRRIEHWSRRLDHAFIHFASACLTYATSGRIDYFLINVAFNMDCAYRQFEKEVRPNRNLTRTAMSILFYLLPVVVHGQYTIFLQFLLMFAVGFWLFVRYPFGGWSHSMFHLTITFLPVLALAAAMRLESSQPQISLATKCADMAGQQ